MKQAREAATGLQRHGLPLLPLLFEHEQASLLTPSNSVNQRTELEYYMKGNATSIATHRVMFFEPLPL
jgi:hypothetical protein